MHLTESDLKRIINEVLKNPPWPLTQEERMEVQKWWATVIGNSAVAETLTTPTKES